MATASTTAPKSKKRGLATLLDIGKQTSPAPEPKKTKIAVASVERKEVQKPTNGWPKLFRSWPGDLIEEALETLMGKPSELQNWKDLVAAHEAGKGEGLVLVTVYGETQVTTAHVRKFPRSPEKSDH